MLHPRHSTVEYCGLSTQFSRTATTTTIATATATAPALNPPPHSASSPGQPLLSLDHDNLSHTTRTANSNQRRSAPPTAPHSKPARARFSHTDGSPHTANSYRLPPTATATGQHGPRRSRCVASGTRHRPFRACSALSPHCPSALFRAYGLPPAGYPLSIRLVRHAPRSRDELQTSPPARQRISPWPRRDTDGHARHLNSRVLLTCASERRCPAARRLA